MIKVYECYTPLEDDGRGNEKTWCCELWGGSTKHPDAQFYYNDWSDRSPYLDDEVQVYQWLLWIASRRQWPFHAKELAEYAAENWYRWE